MYVRVQIFLFHYIIKHFRLDTKDQIIQFLLEGKNITQNFKKFLVLFTHILRGSP